MGKHNQKSTKPKNPNMIRSSAFKPGNTYSLGNDKTLRLGTLLDKVLDTPKEIPTTVEEYDAIRTKRQAMAEELIDAYFDAKEPLVKKALFDTIADRTEGKPKQAVELSGDAENPISFVIAKAQADRIEVHKEEHDDIQS